MSGNLNQVTLIGQLGRDPEALSFAAGGEIVKLSIGTTETWRDRTSGERRQMTEWHTVVISADGLIPVAKRYLRKGSKVFVQGKLAKRKWTDHQGHERFAWEVKVGATGQMLLLDRPPEGDGDRHADRSAERPQDPDPKASAAGSGVDLDDDVPF